MQPNNLWQTIFGYLDIQNGYLNNLFIFDMMAELSSPL